MKLGDRKLPVELWRKIFLFCYEPIQKSSLHWHYERWGLYAGIEWKASWDYCSDPAFWYPLHAKMQIRLVMKEEELAKKQV